MIKANYDPKTGKVIAFNKDIEPYIEITEEARKQPLPNKYSWYAVENNQFIIKSRTPTALQTMYDALNQGQRKKILKNEKVKILFERYGVEV